MPAERDEPAPAPDATTIPEEAGDENPQPDARQPHSEGVDKDYDELELLRRVLFTQR
jgi:hypothetical protein